MNKILQAFAVCRKTRLRTLTKVCLSTMSILVLWSALQSPEVLHSAESILAPVTQGSGETNLLLNPSFEENFYWQYPNHYVAKDWNRWWIHGSSLPEYTDSSAHSFRPHYDGERAQAWHVWGRTYTAGIYQVTHHANPCTLYQLSAWTQNHSLDDALPHARVGLDPEGTQLTPSSDSGAVLSLPPRTAWSREQETLYAWENLTVTTEALDDKLTAIFYTSPERGSRNSTYFFDSMWDAASLIPVDFPDGRLPVPEASEDPSFIYNVTTEMKLNTLVIEWDTMAPASTQVLYEIHKPTAVITSGSGYTSTVYIPIVSKAPRHPSTYELATSLDPEPVLHHRSVIGNLEDESTLTISFVPLSRYRKGSGCITEMQTAGTVTVKIPKIHQTYLPSILGSTPLSKAHVYGR